MIGLFREPNRLLMMPAPTPPLFKRWNRMVMGKLRNAFWILSAHLNLLSVISMGSAVDSTVRRLICGVAELAGLALPPSSVARRLARSTWWNGVAMVSSRVVTLAVTVWVA